MQAEAEDAEAAMQAEIKTSANYTILEARRSIAEARETLKASRATGSNELQAPALVLKSAAQLAQQDEEMQRLRREAEDAKAAAGATEQQCSYAYGQIEKLMAENESLRADLQLRNEEYQTVLETAKIMATKIKDLEKDNEMLKKWVQGLAPKVKLEDVD